VAPVLYTEGYWLKSQHYHRNRETIIILGCIWDAIS